MNNLVYRLANEADLIRIIHLLSEDELGAGREVTSIDKHEDYLAAFRRIENDSNQELTVVLEEDVIIATFQLSFIQYLTYQGGLRAQIEAVRVSSARRGKGIGKQIFEYAISRAKQKGCHMIQLTTDKRRPEAIRFYESLGFIPSHEGMKLFL